MKIFLQIFQIASLNETRLLINVLSNHTTQNVQHCTLTHMLPCTQISDISAKSAITGLCITVTSQWARWRLKSPASQLFTQPFIQVQIKENIKVQRHLPLCGEFTGDRLIPRTNGQLRGKCFHLMTSSWYCCKDSHGHHMQVSYGCSNWNHRGELLCFKKKVLPFFLGFKTQYPDRFFGLTARQYLPARHESIYLRGKLEGTCI